MTWEIHHEYRFPSLLDCGPDNINSGWPPPVYCIRAWDITFQQRSSPVYSVGVKRSVYRDCGGFFCPLSPSSGRVLSCGSGTRGIHYYYITRRQKKNIGPSDSVWLYGIAVLLNNKQLRVCARNRSDTRGHGPHYRPPSRSTQKTETHGKKRGNIWWSRRRCGHKRAVEVERRGQKAGNPENRGRPMIISTSSSRLR